MFDFAAPARNLILIGLAGLLFIVFYRNKFAAEWSRFRTHRREWLYEKWKNWGEPFLVALVLAVGIRVFLFAPYKIPSGSMIPTFLVGDRIFVDKVSYRFQTPKRGDMIVFKYPLDKKKEWVLHFGHMPLHLTWDSRKDFVKRLAGLPGDQLEVREGKLVVNGKTMDDPPFSNNYYYNRDDWPYGKRNQVITVPADEYFALGDNSAQSSDSRFWGFVPKQNMVGKAFFIWWPPRRIKFAK